MMGIQTGIEKRMMIGIRGEIGIRTWIGVITGNVKTQG
jgi:hypothetical protein